MFIVHFIAFVLLHHQRDQILWIYQMVLDYPKWSFSNSAGQKHIANSYATLLWSLDRWILSWQTFGFEWKDRFERDLCWHAVCFFWENSLIFSVNLHLYLKVYSFFIGNLPGTTNTFSWSVFFSVFSFLKSEFFCDTYLCFSVLFYFPEDIFRKCPGSPPQQEALHRRVLIGLGGLGRRQREGFVLNFAIVFSTLSVFITH